MEEDPAPSPKVIEQQVRNRQLEWLEMAAEVESDPPPFDLNEVINQWFDWNPDVPCLDAYAAPTYTEREAERLVEVGRALNRLCAATPSTIADDWATLATPEWASVVALSKQALVEMLLRGRLSESD